MLGPDLTIPTVLTNSKTVWIYPDRFEQNFPNFPIIQTDLTWFRPFWNVQNGRPLCRYGFRDRFDHADRFGQILNYDETKKMTKLSMFER